MFQTFDQIRKSHEQTIRDISASEVSSMILALVSAIEGGSTIFVCGNGGSAADAQHFVAELVVRFERPRKALKALALTTDTSIITAAGNDWGYDSIFARQIEALGRKGDILLCLSTSGQSTNVILAMRAAKMQNMKIWSIVGNDGCDIAIASDITIILNGNTARVQEGTMLILHFLASVADEVASNARQDS
jgi:phosphoheptose isomerase